MGELFDKIFRSEVIDDFTLKLNGIDSSNYPYYHPASTSLPEIKFIHNSNPCLIEFKSNHGLNEYDIIEFFGNGEFGVEELLNNCWYTIKNDDTSVTIYADTTKSKPFIENSDYMVGRLVNDLGDVIHITKSNPCRITFNIENTLVSGNFIRIDDSRNGQGINNGMNQLIGNIYEVSVIDSTHVDLVNVDSSDYDQYVYLEMSLLTYKAVKITNAHTLKNVQIGSSYDDITIGKHLPDMFASDFIKELKTYLALAIDFDTNSNSVRIKKLNDIISNPAFEDITKYVFQHIENDLIPIDGYKLGFTPDDGDELSEFLKDPDLAYNRKADVSVLPTTGNVHNDLRKLTTNNYMYLYQELNTDLITHGTWTKKYYDLNSISNGAQQLNLVSAFSPMFPIWANDDLYGAVTNLSKLSCYSFPALKQNYPPRLFFDSGKITTDTLRLDYKSAISLYEKLHKNWIYYNLNVRKDGKLPIYWPDWLIAKFDFFKKYRIDGTNYFIKAIEFDIDADGKNIYKDSEVAKC